MQLFISGVRAGHPGSPYSAYVQLFAWCFGASLQSAPVFLSLLAEVADAQCRSRSESCVENGDPSAQSDACWEEHIHARAPEEPLPGCVRMSTRPALSSFTRYSLFPFSPEMLKSCRETEMFVAWVVTAAGGVPLQAELRTPFALLVRLIKSRKLYYTRKHMTSAYKTWEFRGIFF